METAWPWILLGVIAVALAGIWWWAVRGHHHEMAEFEATLKDLIRHHRGKRP